MLGLIYGVGHIWTSTTNNDPATTLGFGTWLKLEAVVLGAHKAGDSDFGVVAVAQVGADFGEKEHVLTEDEMPSHTHSLDFRQDAGGGGAAGYVNYNSDDTLDVNSTGGDAAHNNMQLTRVVYMWERTA